MPAGSAAGLLALFRTHKAPEFRQREQQLAELLARRAASIVEASYDALTGAADARRVRAAARSCCWCRRRDGRKAQWTSLYIDADRMHVINDNFGMHVGDKLLAKMGELIRARLVPGSLAARISGDRFAMLLPTGAEDAMISARRCAPASRPRRRAAGRRPSRGHLLGLGEHRRRADQWPGLDLAHALAVAETACKAAKDRGRNRVELYQASDCRSSAATRT